MTARPSVLAERPAEAALPDPLSSVLGRARVEAAFFSRALGASPWAVETRGAASGIFHVVVRGAAVLEVDGHRVELHAGELVVLPSGPAHVLRSSAPCRPTWIGELPRADTDGLPTVCAGTGEPDTEVLCGTLRFGPFGDELVGAHLPPVLHARGPALAPWVRALSTELAARPPGAEAVAACLGELLFLLALREWLDGADAPGWLAGLVHPDLGRALARVQADPAADWTVARLARVAGLSRTVFASQFARIVGMTPVAWVIHWRMLIARQLLADPRQTIAAVAEAVGYASEAAFHRAFHRELGEPPARWRRRTATGPST